MRKIILFSLVVIMMLAGCNSSPAPLTPLAGLPTNTSQAVGYPDENQIAATPSGYPAPEFTLATMVPTSTPDAAKTPITIASVTHTTDGLEVITIKNISQTDQDISLYSLLNPDTQELYTFPSNTKLTVGQVVYIYNGTGATYPNGQKWLDKPYLTTPGIVVQLLNQASRIIYTYTYYP